jgi:CheY-like chemotaxis protein
MILFTHAHPGLAEVFASLLRAKGFPAKTAENSFKCLLAILDHPPEQPLLVVLYYRMPGMNGNEVLGHIRGDPTLAHTPVVILASDSEHPRRREQAMSLGVMAWVPIGMMWDIPDFNAMLDDLGRIYEQVGGVKVPQRA